MSTISQLKWSSLTAAINEIRAPNQFLRRLLYGNVQTLSTEDIELSVLNRGRKTAPFVRKNGEGIMISGHDETFQTVQAPNIRIKRPLTPSDLLYTRRPGTAIFPDFNSQQTAIQAHINRDLAALENDIVNAEEWLAAQTLRGEIEYEVADGEVFTITYPRSGTHNTALTTARAWDNATLTNPRPLQDVHSIKRILSDSTGVQATDAICGRNAADALLNLAETGNLPALKTDSGISSGNISFIEQFNDDGAVFLGMLGGVRFWEYGREVEHTGSNESFIRTDYVEFVSSNSNIADRVMYYGAIPDMDALQGGLWVGRRFSKSWTENDPSTMMVLAHSRPLPVPRRPDAQVSLKVANIA